MTRLAKHAAWFFAALTVNGPWIGCLALVLKMIRDRAGKGPVAGEIWLLPVFAWLCNGPAIALVAVVIRYGARPAPQRADVTSYVAYSLAILMAGPVFAAVYFG